MFAQETLFIAGIVFIFLIFVGFVFAKLYKRSTKEISFVRTGWRGELVVQGGGCLCFPVLHEIVPVNMNTIKIEIARSDKQALITKDRMRVDVVVECFMNVKPDKQSISTAAQTLGNKTLHPDLLRELIEGKMTDALRSVAAEMGMEELHEKRSEFVQRVQQAVTSELLKNGLQLETVSLTRFDQTRAEFFDPQNSFDAQGLTNLTLITESRKKERNEIEQNTRVAIAEKDLEAERNTLRLKRDSEYAKMEQDKEVKTRLAQQEAEIAAEQAARKREAEQAKIDAELKIQEKQIEADRILKEQAILNEQTVEQANITQKKVLELAEQDRAIAVSEKSKSESEAKRQADEARVEAVKAAEAVETARQTSAAERQKAIEIIDARKIAEKDALSITVQAEAERDAAQHRADAKLVEAKAESDAEILLAAAKERNYEVDAEGKRKVNEAQNVLSLDQIQMNLRIELLKVLPAIIEASVKPAENVDSIKIIQLAGQGVPGGNVVSNGASAINPNGNVSMPDQVVNSLLQYRTQAPLIDGLMAELGLKGGDINSLTDSVLQPIQSVTGDNGNTIFPEKPQEVQLEVSTPVEPVVALEEEAPAN